MPKKNLKTRYKKLFLLSILLFAISFTCFADSGRSEKLPQFSNKIIPKNSASLKVQWIDSTGRVYPGTKIFSMQWIWLKSKNSEELAHPALRISIHSKLPAHWKPTAMNSEGLNLVTPFVAGTEQSITIDLLTTKARQVITFQDAAGNNFTMQLSIEMNLSRPYILVNPSCRASGMRFVIHKSEGRHLFVGLNCADLGDKYEIHFFKSSDSHWLNADELSGYDLNNEKNAFYYTVKKPKDQVVFTQKLFRAGTIDSNNQPNIYSVYYYPKVKPKRFYSSVGLGFTYYDYSEVIDNIKVNQLSLTGKVNLGYRLIPKVLDIAFNGFGTVISPTHSGSSPDLPESRFYGLNGRLGYRLPVDLGATEFLFLTGWYFWGMIVANNQYGIASLTGPQLFFTMLNSQAGHSGWWAYFKFAMISKAIQITELSNREIAVGGGLELSARETKPFSITLDIAHAQFAEKDKELNNGMKLLSVTLGVSKSL